MKFRVEADCTPTEARAFLGLPDVAPLNERMVQEMSTRMSSNMSMLKPEEFMKSWMSLGGQAQDQFMKMMTSAASGGMGSTTSR